MSNSRVRTKAAAQAGFTLLEIMVALVVFGILVAGLAQGVQFGLRAWNGQTALIAQRGDMEAVDSALRGLIEAMDPGSARATAATTMVGKPHGFAFATELPEGAADADDRHADVALGVDANHDLVLRWTPHLHAVRLAGAASIESDVLLGGVARVDFQYWQNSTTGGTWSDQWNNPGAPALVRIQIIFKDDRSWPAIVVATMRQPAD